MKRIVFAVLALMLMVFLCGCENEVIIGTWELSRVEMRTTGSEGVHSETTFPGENGTAVKYTFGKDGFYCATAATYDNSTRTEEGSYDVMNNYLRIKTDDSDVTGIWRISDDQLILIMGESNDNATMYFEKID